LPWIGRHIIGRRIDVKYLPSQLIDIFHTPGGQRNLQLLLRFAIVSPSCSWRWW